MTRIELFRAHSQIFIYSQTNSNDKSFNLHFNDSQTKPFTLATLSISNINFFGRDKILVWGAYIKNIETMTKKEITSKKFEFLAVRTHDMSRDLCVHRPTTCRCVMLTKQFSKMQSHSNEIWDTRVELYEHALEWHFFIILWKIVKLEIWKITIIVGPSWELVEYAQLEKHFGIFYELFRRSSLNFFLFFLSNHTHAASECNAMMRHDWGAH